METVADSDLPGKEGISLGVEGNGLLLSISACQQAIRYCAVLEVMPERDEV